MLRSAPVWIALMLGTLLGMVTQFILSRKENWFDSVCTADQPGWSCFLEYTVGSAVFGLVCAALWSATHSILKDHSKKTRIERDTLRIFSEMMSAFNSDLSTYLHPMEKRLFVETMREAGQQHCVDTAAQHRKFKDYRRMSNNRYDALRRTISRLDALLAVIDISSETENSIIHYVQTVGEFFEYEIEKNRPPSGDSILELTSDFVTIEEQKIADHKRFADKIDAAYQDFSRHLALDPKYSARSPR